MIYKAREYIPAGPPNRKNEMNLCDSCETVSHCTAHGCIPLTECVNSGQVSAAQVVAHAENGDVNFKPLCNRCEAIGECTPRGIESCQIPREVVAHQEAGELPPLPEPYGYGHYSWVHGNIPIFTSEQMRAYAIAALAAERAEVVRLREAAEAVLSNEEHAFSGGMRNYQKGSQTWQVYEDLRIALTAPGEKHD